MRPWGCCHRGQPATTTGRPRPVWYLIEGISEGIIRHGRAHNRLYEFEGYGKAGKRKRYDFSEDVCLSRTLTRNPTTTTAMVPIPVWTERPVDPRLVDPTITTGGPLATEGLPFVRNVSGRAWKSVQATATVRTQKAGKMGTSWAKRQVTRAKDDSVKLIER